MSPLAKCLHLVFISSFIHVAWANFTNRSSQTAYLNATVTPFVSPTAGSGRCPTNCTRFLSDYYSVYWSPLSITATVTAETVLYVVNPRNNITRTETITNTEADLSNFKKPNNTNSAGTQVATVTSWDGSKSVRSLITYPTAYTAYDNHYSISGILPTTIAGNPTCIRATNGGLPSYLYSTFTFPSHPPAPTPTPISGAITVSVTEDRVDPRGWTYSAVYEDLTCTNQDDLQPLFPDLGMWNCKQPLCAAPAVYHGTALYLTGTSISTESGEPTASANVQQSTDSAKEPPLTRSVASAQIPAQTPAQSSPAGESSKAAVAVKPSSDATNVAPSSPQQQAPAPSAPQGTLIMSAASAAPSVVGNSLSTVADHPPALVPPSVAGNQPSSAINGPPAPIVINSKTISANSASQYLVSSQTLIPGGSPIRLGSGPNAQTIAIQTSNAKAVLIIGSSSSQLQLVGPAATTPPASLAPGGIVIGSQTIAANSASQYIIASQTLAVGALPITLRSGVSSAAQGVAVALQTSDSQTYLVVGSSTSLVQPLTIAAAATTTTSMGIGGFVASGFNNGGATTGPAAFTGGANHMFGRTVWTAVGGLLGVTLVIIGII